MNERRIHFLCSCGRTLSAEAGIGESLKCDGCGRKVGIPVARERITGEVKRPVDGASRQNQGKSNKGIFDFDAEIVHAARTSVPRALKTPSGVTRTPSEEIARSDEESRPGRLRRSARLLRVLSLLALLAVGGAAAPAFFLPLPLWQRGVLAFVLLVAGISLFAGLATLRVLCLTLADRE